MNQLRKIGGLFLLLCLLGYNAPSFASFASGASAHQHDESAKVAGKTQCHQHQQQQQHEQGCSTEEGGCSEAGCCEAGCECCSGGECSCENCGCSASGCCEEGCGCSTGGECTCENCGCCGEGGCGEGGCSPNPKP